MEIIARGRRLGKTESMVRWFRDNPGSVLMVADYRERNRILKHYEMTEEESRRVLIFSDRKRLRGMAYRTKVGIDNLDWFLTYALHSEVAVGSITIPDEEEE